MTGGNRRRRRPLLRMLAWALAATSLLTVTTAFAASLSVASKNLTAFRTCLVTGTPNTSTAISSDGAMIVMASRRNNF